MRTSFHHRVWCSRTSSGVGVGVASLMSHPQYDPWLDDWSHLPDNGAIVPLHPLSRLCDVSLVDLSQEFDSSVLARVLAKGRSTGAGFSEVFIEDKRNMGASLDDGKVEAVNSSRDSGAGIHS